MCSARPVAQKYPIVKRRLRAFIKQESFFNEESSNIKYFLENNKSATTAVTLWRLTNFPLSLLFLFLFLLSLKTKKSASKSKQSSSRGPTWWRNPEKYCKFESYREVKSLLLFRGARGRGMNREITGRSSLILRGKDH